MTEEQEQKPCTDSSSITVTPTNDDIYIYIYQDSSGKMVRQLAPILQLTGCSEKPCSNVGSKLLIANHIFNEWLFNPYTCSQIEKVRSNDAQDNA